MSELQAICKTKKEELGISSTEIAEKSGLSVSTVRNFLSGANKAPTMQTVAMICKALGISLDDYFGIPRQAEDPITARVNAETIEMLKHGIRTRNYILLGFFVFNMILLIAAILVHLVYY